MPRAFEASSPSERRLTRCAGLIPVASQDLDLHHTVMPETLRTSTPTEVLAGLVDRVTFHNSENGFCVLTGTWPRLMARLPDCSAERHIDDEQPLPWPDQQDRGCDARPERRRYGSHQRIYRDTTAELVAGIDEAHERVVDAHDARATEPLEDS